MSKFVPDVGDIFQPAAPPSGCPLTGRRRVEEKFVKCPRKEAEAEEAISFLERRRTSQTAPSPTRMKFSRVVVVVTVTLCLHHASFSSAQVRTGDRRDGETVSCFLFYFDTEEESWLY